MHKTVHREREFIVARASAYHAGFNSGFNIAEAVNFALPSWIDVAKTVTSCKCQKDSVKINIDFMRRVMNGEDPAEILLTDEEETYEE